MIYFISYFEFLQQYLTHLASAGITQWLSLLLSSLEIKDIYIYIYILTFNSIKYVIVEQEIQLIFQYQKPKYNYLHMHEEPHLTRSYMNRF